MSYVVIAARPFESRVRDLVFGPFESEQAAANWASAARDDNWIGFWNTALLLNPHKKPLP